MVLAIAESVQVALVSLFGLVSVAILELARRGHNHAKQANAAVNKVDEGEPPLDTRITRLELRQEAMGQMVRATAEDVTETRADVREIRNDIRSINSHLIGGRQ